MSTTDSRNRRPSSTSRISTPRVNSLRSSRNQRVRAANSGRWARIAELMASVAHSGINPTIDRALTRCVLPSGPRTAS